MHLTSELQKKKVNPKIRSLYSNKLKQQTQTVQWFPSGPNKSIVQSLQSKASKLPSQENTEQDVGHSELDHSSQTNNGHKNDSQLQNGVTLNNCTKRDLLVPPVFHGGITIQQPQVAVLPMVYKDNVVSATLVLHYPTPPVPAPLQHQGRHPKLEPLTNRLS